MRQLAELLSDKPGKVSRACATTRSAPGKTGLGPTRSGRRGRQLRLHLRREGRGELLAEQPAPRRPASLCTRSAKAPSTRCHLPTEHRRRRPKIRSLGLFQPLPGRYLDIITDRVRASAAPEALNHLAGRRRPGPHQGHCGAENLPEGLGALLNPGNVKAVIETDKIDPLTLAAKVPAGTHVLLTCSDADQQATCAVGQAARRRAQAHRPDRGKSQRGQPTRSATIRRTTSPITPSRIPFLHSSSVCSTRLSASRPNLAP